MKKKIWLTIAAVIVLLAGGYSIIGDPFIAYHNHCLKQRIHMISEAEVTLNEIVPFEWDTVYTFDPYTSRSEIEEIIGFPGSAIQETVSEGMVQLLFVKGSKVTGSVCGYAENLGYRVDFRGEIKYEDHTPFHVHVQNDIVCLTQR